MASQLDPTRVLAESPKAFKITGNIWDFMEVSSVSSPNGDRF